MPKSHLAACELCGKDGCRTEGRGGEGVNGTDLLLYVSTVQSRYNHVISYAVKLCVDLSMRLSYGSSGCVSRAVLLWPMPPIASKRPGLTDPLLPMSTSALVALRRARMELPIW